MPLRHYKATQPGRCPLCKEGFDHYQSAAEASLEECPRCGAPVEPLQGEVNSPRAVRKIGTVEAKDAGFTVMQRNAHGLYEKQ